MANEIHEAGYADLRAYIMAQWDHFSVRYRGTERLSLDLTDPRVAAQERDESVVFTIALSLDDPDVQALAPPRVIDEVALIAETGDEDVASETFDPFTFAAATPELTVTYGIRVPTEGLPGPQGPQGPPGTLWFTGDGPPDPEPPGSRPGDLYLDLDTGDLYELQGA